ncbi:hypothetical protein BpHYR1_011278 [Brachionus plicatilis]|uniref:Uncharacterized protein n=1 Tax=Brachionus plicatilis TaxID=10195 RepID=A0A3M7QTP8_BRAPC|nr:hypothetical protein BpHYR1_011278 [Brachionus plicatilis]
MSMVRLNDQCLNTQIFFLSLSKIKNSEYKNLKEEIMLFEKRATNHFEFVKSYDNYKSYICNPLTIFAKTRYLSCITTRQTDPFDQPESLIGISFLNYDYLILKFKIFLAYCWNKFLNVQNVLNDASMLIVPCCIHKISLIGILRAIKFL